MLSSHILFTYEDKNKHSELLFLDILVKRKLSVVLNLTIYRKPPTHSNHYADFNLAEAFHVFLNSFVLNRKKGLTIHPTWTIYSSYVV